METEQTQIRRKRRHRRRRNDRGILLVMILVLIAVLIGVVSVAVRLGGSSDTPGSSAALELNVSASIENGTATIQESVTFSGTSDPAVELALNGVPVSRGEDGRFSVSAELSIGQNDFTFTYDGDSVPFSFERRYIVESYDPSGSAEFASGQTVSLQVVARTGSTVTAELYGVTVALSPSETQPEDLAQGCMLYVGDYTMPDIEEAQLTLGAIFFIASCDGVGETCTSGTITCLGQTQTTEATDSSAEPSRVNYLDVGTGYIAEVVNGFAETFDGTTTDDYSHPTNSYLPQGTVDYCAEQVIVNGKLQYVQLRCGRRIYVDTSNIPSSTRITVTECYSGTLPDHNEIGFVSMTQEGNHTVLVLDCLWKAPFYFDLLPQSYAAPDDGSDRSYAITDFTATYVDITFCYATSFTGTVQIPADNPLFRSAQVIQNASDYTLRLYLKQTGGFYGWDCAYNEQGQLCFTFLNPAQVTASGNAYGADLTGVTILLDVGHGGVDPGTIGTDASGGTWSEADRNLALAQAIQEELESMGATVVLNREGDTSIRVNDRIEMLRELAPDLCIAIHHNSLASVPSWSGFESLYYTPFSMSAANFIYENTLSADIYVRCKLAWNVYFMARQTVCPVVLTENGYMSNLDDLSDTYNSAVIAQKAQAIAQGVADYFLSLRN